MRAFATKSSSDTSTRDREPQREPGKLTPIAPAWGLSALTPLILQRKAACACGGGCPRCQPRGTRLPISQPSDTSEIEADRIADKIMRMPDNESSPEHGQSQSPALSESVSPLIQTKGQTKSEGGVVTSDVLSNKIISSRGGGSSLDSGVRSFMQSRFAADFSGVKIHTDGEAAHMNRELSARAFTLGKDIYFNEGEYQPNSDRGKRLLAHELTHTIQQGESSSLQPMLIQRDLAVEPTAPDAVGRVLSATQMARAIRWNQAAFTDADEIALIRDVLGIPAEPAVIDEDFVNALVQYQANFGLTQDGLLGSGTALRLASELQAEATFLGADADVGTATEMALNPAQRRMRLRSRVVNRLGQLLHQGFIGSRENPTGIVTVRSGFTNPGRADLTNSIGINYTGNNADNSRWLQFAFRQMSAIDPATRRRVYRSGTTSTSAGLGRPYSDGTTFRWAVDTAPAAGSMYYEAGFTAERVAGAHTETFDQPNRWNIQAESYAASFTTRPSRVRMINGFDTYLIVNNNSVVYHVRWNIYFNFDTSVSPTPDVPGTYEVLSAGEVSRLPADRKAALDAAFPTNTVP